MRRDEEVKRIHAALTECNGDREAAAIKLGIEKRQLTQMIHSLVSLKRAWGQPKPPNLPVAIPIPQMVTQESFEELERKNDEQFENLLAKTLNPSEMETSRSLSKMFGRHLGQVANLVGGTLIERAMKLKDEISKAEQRLEIGFGGDDAGQQLKATYEFITNGNNTLISIMEIINKSAMARAKLREMEQAKNGGKPNGKPGFGPKMANVVQNVAVGT